jgi:hypothetical protein
VVICARRCECLFSRRQRPAGRGAAIDCNQPCSDLQSSMRGFAGVLSAASAPRPHGMWSAAVIRKTTILIGPTAGFRCIAGVGCTPSLCIGQLQFAHETS